MVREFIANFLSVAPIAYFLFIVGGSIGIAIGAARCWNWVRNPWFRFSHLTAAYIMIIEDAVRVPSNTMEWLSQSSPGPVIEASSGFGGLLDHLLFQSLAVLLLIALIFVPPQNKHRALGTSTIALGDPSLD